MMEYASVYEIKNGNDFVIVYLCSLQDAPLNIALSDEELAKANTFIHSTDKQRYITAHTLLRTILSAYTLTTPDAIAFTTTQYGKPLLHPSCNPNHIHFNLSYRGDWALIAISSKEIGADIEQYRAIDDIDHFAGQFFSPDEIVWLQTHADPNARQHAFFQLWAMKEAYIKATGKGLNEPLSSFSVLQSTTSHIQKITVPEGYAAAVAYR